MDNDELIKFQNTQSLLETLDNSMYELRKLLARQHKLTHDELITELCSIIHSTPQVPKEYFEIK